MKSWLLKTKEVKAMRPSLGFVVSSWISEITVSLIFAHFFLFVIPLQENFKEADKIGGDFPCIIEGQFFVAVGLPEVNCFLDERFWDIHKASMLYEDREMSARNMCT